MAHREPILVVDDDESYRAILRYHLENVGYRVLEAADGRKAFEILSRLSVPLAVLDIVMPNNEGLETISRLRREGRRTKILAITGAASAREYLHVASLLGADATIEKTQPVSEVVTLVRSLIGAAQATDRAGLEASVH